MARHGDIVASICETHIGTCRLPVRRPLNTAVGSIHERCGVLIRVIDDDGIDGVGEAAPLSGFSPENIDLAVADLESSLDAQGPVIGRVFDSIDDVFTVVAQQKIVPSAAFALETALSDLMAKQRGLSCAVLWSAGEQPRDRVRTRQLIANEKQAHECLARGVRDFKTKVGKDSIGADLERVHLIAEVLRTKPPTTLTVDANGAWSFDAAKQAICDFAARGIDCVEQPLAANAPLSHFRKLRDSTDVAIALDESIRNEAELCAAVEARAADLVVVKPMFCGGVAASLRLARIANDSGVETIVTHSLESAVGRAATAHVAAALPHPKSMPDRWAHGLSAVNWLSDDLGKGLIDSTGSIEISSARPQGLGITVRPTSPINWRRVR